MEDIISS